MTAMHDRPFPSGAGWSSMPAMAMVLPREADLSLRAAREFVRPRVVWPPAAEDGSAIVVLISDDGTALEGANALCLHAGAIVLALQTAELDVATIAVEWVGDHARLLGGDPDRLAVAGGGLAARAALHARDEGWPPLARQLLIGPQDDTWPEDHVSLAGAAPATVVDAPGYAARLCAAGVEVEELSDSEPLSFAWAGPLVASS
jgi:alpha/beta hydrolase fold